MTDEYEPADDAAPPPPPAERPRTVPGLLESLNITFDELTRYVAGYNTLTRVYRTLTDTRAPGERPKGLIIGFKGSADDQHVIDVNVDVQKDVDQQYVAHVIAPLANGQATGMLRAVDRMLKQGQELKAFIETALGLAKPPG